jgi:hypothetical protein
MYTRKSTIHFPSHYYLGRQQFNRNFHCNYHFVSSTLSNCDHHRHHHIIMSTVDKDLVVRYFVLPIFVGWIVALISFFSNRLSERTERRRSNHKLQLEKATEVCHALSHSADTLYQLLQHQAWYIAWRKARPEGHVAELLESDAEAWKDYLKVVLEWRTNEIQFETDLAAFFGPDGIEARLFRSLWKAFELAANQLWNIYYASKQETPKLTIRKDGDSADGADGHGHCGSILDKGAMTTLQEKDLTEQDQEHSRLYFDALLEEIRQDLTMLSVSMVRCIQHGFVGNLRTDKKRLKELELEAAEIMEAKSKGASKKE